MANTSDIGGERGHSSAMRWGLRLACVVFGTAIGLVIASEPKVIETVRVGVSFITSHLTGDQSQRYRPGAASSLPVHSAPLGQDVLSVNTASDAAPVLPRPAP